MKALVGAFNQEKALVGAYSMIVKTDGSFAAVVVSCRMISLSNVSRVTPTANIWPHSAGGDMVSSLPHLS